MMRSSEKPEEVRKFDRIVETWWVPDGDFKPLHDINPTRTAFIASQVDLAEKTVLDVGCGGGILSESLAQAGASVTGIDASPNAIAVAKQHAIASGLNIQYHHSTAEAFLETRRQQVLDQYPYDVVTCLELLEHVAHPHLLVSTLAELTIPGGHLFFSTLNRTPKAYLLAILGAEYVLGILPKGTHHYRAFIRPSELDSWARSAGLTRKSLTGIAYNPLTNLAKTTKDVRVNYLACYQKTG